jgi:hypothetical protein
MLAPPSQRLSSVSPLPGGRDSCLRAPVSMCGGWNPLLHRAPGRFGGGSRQLGLLVLRRDDV